MPTRYLSPVASENPEFDEFLDIYAGDQVRRQNIELRQQEQADENLSRGLRTGFASTAQSIEEVARAREVRRRDDLRAATELDEILLRQYGIRLHEAQDAAAKGGQPLHKFLEQLEHEQRGEVWGRPQAEQEQYDLIDSQIQSINHLAESGEFFPDSTYNGEIRSSIDANREIERLRKRQATYRERWHKPPVPQPTVMERLEGGQDVQYVDKLPDGRPLPYPVLMGTDRNGLMHTIAEFPDKNAEVAQKQKLEQRKQDRDDVRDKAKLRNDLIKQNLELQGKVAEYRGGTVDYEKAVTEVDAAMARMFPAAGAAGGSPAGAVPPPTGPPAPSMQPQSEQDPIRRVQAREEAIPQIEQAAQQFATNVQAFGKNLERLSTGARKDLIPGAMATLRYLAIKYPGGVSAMSQEDRELYRKAAKVYGREQ